MKIANDSMSYKNNELVLGLDFVFK